jgi:hypothetical protein
MDLIQAIDEYRDTMFKGAGNEQRKRIDRCMHTVLNVSLSEIKDILIPLLADHDYIVPTRYVENI